MAEPVAAASPEAPAAAEPEKLQAGLGAHSYQQMMDAGVPLPAVVDWRAQEERAQILAGHNPKDVAAYWGDGPIDQSGLEALVNKNLSLADPEKVAKSPMELMAAHWNMSIASLSAHEPQYKIEPGTEPLWSKVAGSFVQMAGDIPQIAAGFGIGLFGGAAAGTMAAGPAGGAVGATLGAGIGVMAYPAAVRATLMDGYLNGKFTSFQDFFSRSAGIALTTAKAGAVGLTGAAAASGVGLGAAALGAAPWLAGAAGDVTAVGATAELAAKLDGRSVEPADLINGAINILGMHAAGVLYGATERFIPNAEAVNVTVNLADLYAHTGLPPSTAAAVAGKDIVVRGEVVAPRAADGTLVAPTIKALAPPEPKPYEGKIEIPEPPGGMKAVKPEGAPEGESDRTVSQAGVQTGAEAPEQDTADKMDRALVAIGEPKSAEPPPPPPPPEGLKLTGPEGTPKPPSPADDMKTMGDFIAGKPDQPNFFIRGVQAFRRFVSDFQSSLTNFVELDKSVDAYRLTQAKNGKGELEPNALNSEDHMRFLLSSPAQAGMFIKEGVIRDTGTEVKVVSDDSFLKAINSAEAKGGAVDEFTRYMVAKRLVEKAQQGIDAGPKETVEAAMRIVSDKGFQQKYEAAAQTWYRVTDGIVDYVRDSGRISAEQAERIKLLSHDYITFRRALDPSYQPPQVGRRGLQMNRPIQKMTGSERQITEPLAATVANTHFMVAEANRNRAAGYLVGLAEGKAGPDTADTMKNIFGLSKVRDVTVAPEEAMKLLEGETASGVPLDKQSRVDMMPFVAERTSGGRLRPGEFAYYRDGKMEVWKATNENLANELRSPMFNKLNDVTKFLKFFADLQRAGVTGQASFVFRAESHAQYGATLFAPGKFMLPWQDLATGILDQMGGGLGMQRARANGAINSSLARQYEDLVKNDTSGLLRKTGTLANVVNSFAHPLEAFRAVRAYTTDTAVAGRMIANEKAGLDTKKAAMIARRSHMDFAEKQQADYVNKLGMMTLWAPVVVKTAEQGARALQENPLGTIFRMSMMAVPFALTAAMAIQQDKDLPPGQRSSDIPRVFRDTMIASPRIGGVRVAFPKPYGFAGNFFTAIENGLREWADNDYNAFDAWTNRTLNQFMAPPSFVPVFLSPMIEEWSNQHLYNGTPIVPSGLENQTDWMRYSPDTTPEARGLARELGPANLNLVNMSPMMLENWANDWLGPTPMRTMRVFNSGIGKPGRPWEIADLPFVGSFFLRHNYGLASQPVQDFFNGSENLIKQANSLKTAVEREMVNAYRDNRAPSADDPDILAAGNALVGLHAGSGMNPTDLLLDPRVQEIFALEKAREAFPVVRALLAHINQSKMTGDEKRKWSDALASQMVSAADAGNRMLQAYKARDPEAFKAAQGELGARETVALGMQPR